MKTSFLRLLLSFVFITISYTSLSQSGIYESYVIINTGSGNQLYDLHSPTDTTSDVPTFDFNNSFLGVFGTQNGTLILNGGQNNIYKCPNTDVTSGFLNYRVYPTGSPSGAFTGISLNSSVSTSSGAICSGGFNQMWVTDNFNLSLINGLASGDYTLEVYTLADHTSFGVPQTPHFVNNNGNNFTATFRADNPPVANCQDITIQLDGTGNATITANDINNTSTDDFGIASLAISQSSFTCSDLGTNNVTLTVTDSIGQTDTCVAVVTVEDGVLSATASISSDLGTEICQGDAITFTVAGTNIGLNPQYEWFINTISVGNNSDTFTTTGLNDGDNVYAEITSTSCSGASVTSSSNMTISVFQLPTVDAGPDATMCSNGVLNLNGVFGGSATSATWSSPSGGFIDNDYYPSISGGFVTIYYTTNNPPGPCGPAIDSLQVLVRPFRQAIASYSGTLSDCNDTTISLSGNRTGQWSAVSVPSGSPFGFSNVNDPNATFTGESGTTYEITWTVDNLAPCFDEDTFTVSFPSCGDVIDFDGSDDYINFGDNYNLSGTFSVEAWMKADAINGSLKTILSKRDANDLSFGYDLRLFNTTVAFRADNFNISTSGISSNRWYHIAVTYDGTTYTLYVDGIERSSAAGPSPTSNTYNMLIGAMNRLNNTPINYFNGWLDEVRFWNVALTQEQIQEMMNQEIENNTAVRGSVLGLDISALNWSNLDAYYQMNQGTADLNAGFLVGDVGVPGRLSNITSLQAESAPLPYISANDGIWDDTNTWLNGNVQMIPNTSNVDWNIVRTAHDIQSGNRPTTLLGLIVDTNRYSITSDRPLRVTRYLKIDGILDLVDESQLIQNTGSIVDYTGTGLIERDQQGTTNLYHYNFWSSPVGNNNSSFTVGSVLFDGTDVNNPLPTQWTGNNDADGSTVPVTLSRRWLYLFENYPEASYADWNIISEAANIPVGLGFTMKGSGNSGTSQNYTFRGQPNNGIISTPVTGNYQALVGNPYPSAIDGFTFITDNSTVLSDGTLYFWEHATTSNSHNLGEYEGGYAYLNLTGGTAAVAPPGIAGEGNANKIPQQYIPVGQGFFVTGNASGGTIQFNNGQRAFMRESSGNSIFLRNSSTSLQNATDNSTETNKFIRLDFISPEGAVRHLLLGFLNNEFATEGIDYGFDAPNKDNFSSDMSFNIDGKRFVIQGVGSFNESNSYPMDINLSSEGSIQIQLKTLENFEENIPVFIYDTVENTYTLINEQSFEISLPEGNYTNRFFLVFSDENTLSAADYINNNNIAIHFLQASGEIYVKTVNREDIKDIQLINLIGQTVATWNAKHFSSTDNIRIPVHDISEGNYILRVETQTSSYNKKVNIKF